jgi:putative tryptophan/tyrosine transport system substrate-binding protein
MPTGGGMLGAGIPRGVGERADLTTRRHATLLAAGMAISVLCAPRARAQARAAVPTIGWIAGDVSLWDISGPDPSSHPARAFLHGLRDLGWVDGRTVNIVRRAAEKRPERIPLIVAEFANPAVDVIFAGAADWVVEAVSKSTRTIPIVAVFNRDPAVRGLVASIARPGGNLTGLTSNTGREFYEKRLQLLREVAPSVNRVAFLGTTLAWEDYRGVPDAVIPQHMVALVNHAEDLEPAFAVLRRERADALLVSHGPVLYEAIPRIVAFAASAGLPTICPWREASDAGGLMSYGPSARAVFHQAAGYVDRILRGARPADMPIERPVRLELVINLKTAQALGITVPPTLLARADEVVE